MASIKIKQHDIKDCGATCLASIGNHYNVNLPIARIRQYANTDKRGTNAEKMVKGVIDNFKTEGKTVIVIAHRLSTIANADTILVMENGIIVESGNHHDLLSQNGKYFDLWSKQGLV
jgi:ABC-type bacteriocin/lantibiotic exporter with double-glycine peptidase domain